MMVGRYSTIRGMDVFIPTVVILRDRSYGFPQRN